MQNYSIIIVTHRTRDKREKKRLWRKWERNWKWKKRNAFQIKLQADWNRTKIHQFGTRTSIKWARHTKMIIIIIITTNHILCQDTHTHNLKLNKTQNQDLIIVKQRLYSLGVFLPLHSYTIEHSMMRSSLTSVQPTI